MQSSPSAVPACPRSAIVTGASGGIGSAIATALAHEGFGLTLAGRDVPRLEALSAALSAHGPGVQVVAGDVRDPTHLRTLVERHAATWSGLDMLVNNAGMSGGSLPIAEIDADIVDDLYAVILRSTIRLTREAIPLLLRSARSRSATNVVNVASNAGLRGEGTRASYSAMKAGVVAFTEALHQEYSTSGVRATAVCPGLTDTPMAARYRTRIDPANMLQPSDIAEGVRMLTRVSRACIVPQLTFLGPEEWIDVPPELRSVPS